MLVKNWMSKDVITVDENDSMHDATKRLKENGIERSELQKLIQELESKAGLLYMVGHTENNREIFAEKID